MTDDAQVIADKFGADPEAVRAFVHALALALAAGPDAGMDEVARRFGRESRAFGDRYFDPVSRRTGGFRKAVSDAVTHEAYTLIRRAAGDEDPRRVAARLAGRRGDRR